MTNAKKLLFLCKALSIKAYINFQLLKEDSMPNIHIAFPVVLFMVKMLNDNHDTLHSYLFRLLFNFGIVVPKRLLISILIQPIIGINYQSHYQELYPEIKQFYSSYFQLYCPSKIKFFVNKITVQDIFQHS